MKRKKPFKSFILRTLAAFLLVGVGYCLGHLYPIRTQSTLFTLENSATISEEALTHKILIISGHGTDVTGWYDSGAIAHDGEVEATLNAQLADALQTSLNTHGIQADILNENVYRNMMYYDMTYDFSDYDFVIELHFNASDRGTFSGTEVIYNSYNASDLSTHQAIATALEALTGSSMIYDDDEFLVQRMIAQQGIPGLLLETVYIDNYDDYYTYLDNKDAFVDAITSGLLTIYE